MDNCSNTSGWKIEVNDPYGYVIFPLAGLSLMTNLFIIAVFANKSVKIASNNVLILISAILDIYASFVFSLFNGGLKVECIGIFTGRWLALLAASGIIAYSMLLGLGFDRLCLLMFPTFQLRPSIKGILSIGIIGLLHPFPGMVCCLIEIFRGNNVGIIIYHGLQTTSTPLMTDVLTISSFIVNGMVLATYVILIYAIRKAERTGGSMEQNRTYEVAKTIVIIGVIYLFTQVAIPLSVLIFHAQDAVPITYFLIGSISRFFTLFFRASEYREAFKRLLPKPLFIASYVEPTFIADSCDNNL